jgi:DNA repair protein RadC
MNVRLQEIPRDERPRERLLRHGARVLSVGELVAVVLGRGAARAPCLALARELTAPALSEDQAEDALFASFVDGGAAWVGRRGIGPAQLARLRAVAELALRHHGWRSRRDGAAKRPRPEGFRRGLVGRVARIVPPARRAAGYEWLGFVPVSRQGTLGTLWVVAEGGAWTVVSSLRDLFAPLLQMRPAAFVLVHNHPSGNLRASRDDEELTRVVELIGAQFQVPLLAHVVVTVDGSANVTR